MGVDLCKKVYGDTAAITFGRETFLKEGEVGRGSEGQAAVREAKRA